MACPICARPVLNTDINLHLDLQCPGPGGPPTSSHPTTTPSRRSPSDDPLLGRNDTPADLGRGRPIPGSRGNPVASMFGASSSQSTSKTKSPDSPHAGDETGVQARRVKRPPIVNRTKGNEEKRPRLNPLIANQPLVPIPLFQLMTHDSLQAGRKVPTFHPVRVYRTFGSSWAWESSESKDRSERRRRELHPLGSAGMRKDVRHYSSLPHFLLMQSRPDIVAQFVGSAHCQDRRC